MAFNLENLKGIATDFAQSSVNKSKQVAEITKLKMANMGEEDNIKKAYVEIGKLYYAERGGAPEGAYAAACERVAAAKEAIDANNQRIADLKATDSGEAAEVEEIVVEAETVVQDADQETKPE